MNQLTREAWLEQVSTKHILPLIESKGGKIDYKWRVSVGFPRGSRGGKGAESIGQCWPTQSSADSVHEIFISPKLDTFEAVETLIHEHIHASDSLKSGHRGNFKKLALAIGLEGKMTATVAGPELKRAIEKWVTLLPKYPHAKLSTASRTATKPGSRLIKCACVECGYTVRTTQKWIDIGAPHCPDHGAMLVEGQDGDDDGEA